MKNAKSLFILIYVLGGILAAVSIVDWVSSGWSNDLWLNFVICVSLVGSAIIESKKKSVLPEDN